MMCWITRRLIHGVADCIWEVVAGEVTTYAGDYDYYLWRKENGPNHAGT